MSFAKFNFSLETLHNQMGNFSNSLACEDLRFDSDIFFGIKADFWDIIILEIDGIELCL